MEPFADDLRARPLAGALPAATAHTRTHTHTHTHTHRKRVRARETEAGAAKAALTQSGERHPERVL